MPILNPNTQEVGTAATLLVRMPFNVLLEELYIANDEPTARPVTLWLIPPDQTLAKRHIILPAISIPANSSVMPPEGENVHLDLYTEIWASSPGSEITITVVGQQAT